MATHPMPNHPRTDIFSETPSAVRVAPPSRWGRDLKVEKYLTDNLIAWTYLRDIPLAHIDVEKSRHNNARLNTHDGRGGKGKLIADGADEYARAMLDGAVFPALVGSREPDGRFALWGGNHRVEAARRAKIPTVDLYLVGTSDLPTRQKITVGLNRLEGFRVRRDEAIAQAALRVQQFGVTHREAAEALAVSEKSVSHKVRVLEGQLKLQGLKNVKLDAWSEAAIERIGSIQNDRVRHAAAILQTEVLLSTELFRDLVAEIGQAGTEAAQLAVVAGWDARDEFKSRRIRIKKGGPVPAMHATTRGLVLGALRRADSLLTSRGSLARLGLTSPEDADTALRLARSISLRLEVLVDAYR